jgi:uncharacterized BrkB/YihY/UPF0761 family membrane protein
MRYFGTLALVAGWTITIVVGLIGLLIIWKIATGKIDISAILNEPGQPKASLSRLQFLIFTFVIALSLFLVIVGQNPPGFPKDIPPGIFALLGISAGTYVVSKGVEANRSVELAKANNPNVTV